jgi:hypothetical protein
MTVTPEPAAVAAPAATVPATAYVAPAKKLRNRLGLVGLILVLISFVVPIIVLIVGIVIIATDPNPPVGDNIGWAGIGAVLFMWAGAAAISPLAVAGGILGIVSLFRQGRSKVAGIIAIVLGLPYGLTFLATLPAAISLLGING